MTSPFSLERAARDAAEKTALVFEDGHSWTFATWAERAREVAPRITSSSADHPLALAGTWKESTLAWLGAALELERPILLVHPRASESHRSRLISAARATTYFDGEHELAFENEPYVALPHGAQLLLETSGSSGVPKLVVHTSSSLEAAATASARNLGWEADDRWLVSLPLAHVGGLSALLRCLLARKTSVIGRLATDDAKSSKDLLERLEITLVSLVPTQLARLLADEDFRFPERVRAVLVGGAPLTPELRRRALDRGVPLLATYGMTEFGSQIATERPGDSGNGVGRALPETEIRLDDEGRIFVRGPTACAGYLGKPSPFDVDGWFATNDRGTFDEHGHLHVLGRSDAMLITGGENVHPELVEAALTSHDAVLEACVVGRPHAEWGDEICAVVVLRHGTRDEHEANVTAWLRRELPSYAVPKRLYFWEEIPHLPSGKLDRRATRERVGAGG